MSTTLSTAQFLQKLKDFHWELDDLVKGTRSPYAIQRKSERLLEKHFQLLQEGERLLSIEEHSSHLCP